MSFSLFEVEPHYYDSRFAPLVAQAKADATLIPE